MLTTDLAFDLPAELIAQQPADERSASRLMHYRRTDRSVTHRSFGELPALLRRGDLLVFNDARVIPARFMLRKETGGRVEGLFLNELSPGRWRVMLRNAAGSTGLLTFENANAQARITRVLDDGEYEIEMTTDEPAIAFLERVGRMPLPPYIKRQKDHDPLDDADRARYQTVYAKASGSVAAPTAGLHFTDALLRELDDRGVQRAFVTLHVGMGTFRPVTAARLEDHVMHAEAYTIPRPAADAINAARSESRRVIAVGTTSARVLETQAPDEPIQAKTDQTRIFIYPPYRWKHVDALITNFHLPRSTLIALVAAMVGLDEQRRLYHVAIEQGYRFFSYGDAMFID